MVPTVPPSLLVSRMPGRQTVTAGIWLASGAAHDPEDLAGATHLVEHLTLRRCGGRDRKALARQVDRLGGEVDAWTSSESMAVTAQTTVDALPEALELLIDAMLEPSFDYEDVELERLVTLAELELIQDDPTEQVEDAILEAAWGDHPYARPVIGSFETVSALTAADLRRHHARLVEPGRMLAAVAGDVTTDDVLARVSRLPLVEVPVAPSLPPLAWIGRHLRQSRDGIDQVHARIAFEALPAGHPDEAALVVLNRLLGTGASSRLFQRLREDEGLTYDVWSGLGLRRQGGMLEIGWACSTDAFPAAWRVVREEIRGAVRPTRDEVDIAREALMRGLVMDVESPGGMCSLDVGEVLERGSRFDLETARAELEAVTPEAVQNIARQVLRLDRMASAMYTPAGFVARVA